MRYVLVLTMLLTGSGIAQHQNKIAPDLQNISHVTHVDVIIRWDITPGPNEHGNIAAKGGVLKHDFSWIKAGTITFLLMHSTDWQTIRHISFTSRRIGSTRLS